MDKPQGKPETLAAFIPRMGMTFTATRVQARPDKQGELSDSDERWQREAFHFVVTFKRGPFELTTFYSMGKGHALKHDPRSCKPPKATEVLDSLLSDAESWDNARKIGASEPDIDTFASECGYDDSHEPCEPGKRRSFIARYRECERAFNGCREVHDKLIKMLGADGYAALRDCERL